MFLALQVPIVNHVKMVVLMLVLMVNVAVSAKEDIQVITVRLLDPVQPEPMACLVRMVEQQPVICQRTLNVLVNVQKTLREITAKIMPISVQPTTMFLIVNVSHVQNSVTKRHH